MANREVLLDEPALWLPSALDGAGVPLPGEPQYTPRVDRRALEALVTEGVFDRLGGHLLVRERAAGTNMSVEIDPGFAGVTADGQAYAGRYIAVANAVQTLEIDDAPLSGSRVDRIVLRVHDSSITGTRNEATFEAVKGDTVASGSPPIAALPDSAIELARITVTATVSGQPRVAITAADIVDRREQARVPLGVTEFDPFDQLASATPPETYPSGVTTASVGASGDWPASGTLVTTKRSSERAVQLLSSQFTDVALFYRYTALDGGAWKWAPWRAVPGALIEAANSTEQTITATAFTNTGVAGNPEPIFRAGPTTQLEVHLSGRFDVPTGSGLLINFDIVNNSTGAVVYGTSDVNQVGIDAAPGRMRVSMGRSYIVSIPALEKGTLYRARMLYRTIVGASSTASVAHRRLGVRPL